MVAEEEVVVHWDQQRWWHTYVSFIVGRNAWCWGFGQLTCRQGGFLVVVEEVELGLSEFLNLLVLLDSQMKK